jgi:citrate synthase
MTTWLTAEAAARRLGVKPATLYSYVSRGVLTRRRSGDGHSRFDADEVEQLALRGRPRRARGELNAELVIESALTTLGADRPYYRGHDAIALAQKHELETVAALLWRGELPRREPVWQAPPDALESARAAQACLPADALPLERLQISTTVLAAYDPLRLALEPDAVVTIGRSLIAGLVDSLPAAADRAEPTAGPVTQAANQATISARLERKLTPRPLGGKRHDLIRMALVLLADHELAASTVAARMAASVRADPYAVVAAALGATGGALHGGASLGVEALLAEVDDPARAGAAMGRRLRRGERIPGFGHKVYKGPDGRGVALFQAISKAVPRNPRVAVARAILAEAERRNLPAFNADFALGLLADVNGMVPGAGEAMFAVARTVGWLAHALEEYAAPMKLRLRASYVGEPPG